MTARGEAGAAYKARAKRGGKHATMLATAGLVLALRTAACPGGYTRHILVEGMQTICCGTELPDFSNFVNGQCYFSEDPDDRCKVSDATHRCCVHQSIEGNSFTQCFSLDEAPCKAINVEEGREERDGLQWCPLLTKEDTSLSAGATAGIVVGGILGPFALGLAYKTLT